MPRRVFRAEGGRRQPKPLDVAALEALAVAYVGRYATTRARLEAYLARKLGERGWAAPTAPDPAGLAARLVALGYVDDEAFAGMRAAALARRGYGSRRIDAALRVAGIAEDDRTAVAFDDEQALAAALILARRRRVGPFGPQPADRAAQARTIAILVRGGHDYGIAKAVAALPGGEAN